MISRTHINRLIIFAFMILVGCSLAKAIQSQSITGIILALISLGAGVYFLYLLAKAKQEQEQEEAA
jgi:positive regulator of sigma E activity